MISKGITIPIYDGQGDHKTKLRLMLSQKRYYCNCCTIIGNNIMILDIIGELDHAELTKAGSAVVEDFFFSLNIFMQERLITVSSASL